MARLGFISWFASNPIDSTRNRRLGKRESSANEPTRNNAGTKNRERRFSEFTETLTACRCGRNQQQDAA